MGNKNNVRYNPNCAVCQGKGIYTTSNTSGTQSMTRVCDCHIFYDIEKNSQDLGVDDSSQIEKIKKEAYNQALEDAIALRKRTGNPYNEREGKAILDFEIQARKLKK